MTQLPQPPKGFDPEWAAQNNRVIEGRLRGLTNLEQRVYTAEQLLAGDLTAIATLTGTGFLARTADDSWALRTITGPAAGITVTNGAGIAGNPTLALANDLAALEGLGSTGIAVRTGADAWAQRTITGTAAEITVTNGNGVSGNPTLSLPTALTFTGKTVTGGTFNAGAFNGTVGATTPSTGAFTTISSTGNIGAGISSPAQRMHAYVGAGNVSNLIESGSAASVAVSTIYKTSSRSWEIGQAPGIGDNSFTVYDVTAPAVRLSINTSGLTTLHAGASIIGTFSCTGNATLGDAGTDTVGASGRIFSNDAHNNAGGLAGTVQQWYGSATYTPTGTGVSNVSSIVPAKAQYLRVARVVTVSGTVDISPTAATTTTTFRLSLGVTSSLAALSDLAGSATFIAGSVHGPVVVYADTTNDQAFFSFTSASLLTHSITYQFTYEVL